MMGYAGLGDGTVAGTGTSDPLPVSTTVPAQGFTDGLSAWWTSPTQAVSSIGSALQNTSTAFSGASLGYTLGLFIPPLAILAIVFGGGRKF